MIKDEIIRQITEKFSDKELIELLGLKQKKTNSLSKLKKFLQENPNCVGVDCTKARISINEEIIKYCREKKWSIINGFIDFINRSVPKTDKQNREHKLNMLTQSLEEMILKIQKLNQMKTEIEENIDYLEKFEIEQNVNNRR